MNSKKIIKIFCTRPLPKLIMDQVKRIYPHLQIHCQEQDLPMTGRDILTRVSRISADGLIVTLTEKCDADFIAKLPSAVRWISTMAVGTDNIDLNACKERGIQVAHTPHVLTEATADLTWALILCASRRIKEADLVSQQDAFPGWSPTSFLGKELFGSTLGILGLGRIGSAVARRGCAFGMKVIYRNRKPTEIGKEYGAESVDSIDELCERSDVLSIHCPLNEQSRHLFNYERLKTCRKDSVLVNVARGPIIHESDLVRVLEEGHFLGVGLDVFEDEPHIHPRLKEFTRVVMTPHIGSATWKTRERMMMKSIEPLGEAML